ncbi:LysR family transcriptional regulator [Agrobacterium larrymoorei]|nr:LysR family transcriptional regulator [Agrobacterium larrymoorei]NTJ44684.1 LysR family transcriptional regulator [Agrobacterium larrymoorei]
MNQANNLRNVDLNLLVVLDALLTEQHVSRASLRLGMSQPAVSHALARLRILFDDPLLARKNGSLVLTSKARYLSPILKTTLQQVRTVIGPAQFDAASEFRQFHIAMSDYGSSVILPAMTRLIRTEAPGIDIVVTHSGRQAMMRQVLEGEVDLALGVFPDCTPEMEKMLLFEERFSCLASVDTLRQKTSLSLDQYLDHPHILVTMEEGTPSEIDIELSKIGRARRVATTLPHWGLAARLVVDTDLVLTVARRALDACELGQNVRMFDPPFEIASFPFTQIWHSRRTQDPAHHWLRTIISKAAGREQANQS